MKNRNYREEKLRKQLQQKRREGKKVLIWDLSPNKRKQIEELGYRVEPYLYEIKTRTFYNVRALKSSLLKDLHYMHKRGKLLEVRTLKRGELETLDSYGIRYRPIRFKIYLC